MLKKGISVPISINFEHIQSQCELVRKYIIEDQSYISSTEYRECIELTRTIYGKLKPISDTFLDIVKGLDSGITIYRKDVGKALNFSKRFLKKSSVADFPQSQREKLEVIIEEGFLVGIVFHFLTWAMPTRSNLERVSTETLMQRWQWEALVADNIMKKYSEELHSIPDVFFKYFYETQIHPSLKEISRLGFWVSAKCRSFFKNLFFAGARLGMYWDACTAE